MIWNFDSEYQFERYCHFAQYLRLGFYQTHYFYVLPRLPQKFRERVVFLPGCPGLKNLIQQRKISAKQRLQFKQLVSHLNYQYSAHIGKLKMGFLAHQSEINTALKQVFSTKKKLPQISVCPTLFGTVGSYNIGEQKVWIYPRFDRSWENLVELAVLALTHYYHYPHGVDHNSKMWITKQKLAEKNFKIIAEKFGIKSRNMTDVLAMNWAGRLAQESAGYLKSLGLQVNTNRMLKPTDLTKSEKQLFSVLTKNKNQLVTFDTIADTVWGDEGYEKFSPYAISKLVERLRRKLGNNIPVEIHPQRNYGYILYDLN
jgi:hypothetical protein